MEIKQIAISDIKILENIRTRVQEKEVSGLMKDIQQNGLLHPIGVWEEKGEYILAYGHRRFVACQKLGHKYIDAIILDKLTVQDFLTINTSENIHREDITPPELGRICSLLMDQGLNIPEIATRLAIPEMRVQNSLRLYKMLPAKYRHLVGFGESAKFKHSGKIPSQVMNQVLSLQRNIGKKGIDIEYFIDVIKRDNLSLDQVRAVISLIRTGFSLSDALETRSKFKVVNVRLVLDKQVYDNNQDVIRGNITGYIRNVLLGNEVLIKHLLFFRESKNGKSE